MRALPLLGVIALIQACKINNYTFQPLIYDLSASPAQVDYGQSSTLSWKVGGNVTTLTLNGESVLGTSSKVVSPVRRQVFTVAGSNSLVPITTQQISVAARGLDLVAGSFTGRGNLNGTGNAARFANPVGMVMGGDNAIYVADASNHVIRRVTPQGQVTTFAGMGMSGSDDNLPVTQARFSAPNGITYDNISNYFYVADTSNHTIRKIAQQGGVWVVSTLAGQAGAFGSADGSGNVARFFAPTSVDLDNSGNVYVADTGNHTIRRITPGGMVSTLAGSPGMAGYAEGFGSAARFSAPRGVAVIWADAVYVADTDNHIIRRVTFTGMVSTVAGSPGGPGTDDGPGNSARFNSPIGLVADTGSIIHVADYGNSTIRRMTLLTGNWQVATLAGAGVPGIDDGNGPTARFSYPAGITSDGTGNVYVADTSNQTIRRVTSPAGVVTTLAGSVAIVGNTDGIGAAARFNNPDGVAVDASGNLYVADTSNHAIRKVTAAGVVSTFAGSPGVPGSDDGAAATARFSSPTSVAVDASGNLYVTDTDNNTIRKVTPSGMISTLAGSPGTFGVTDGAGSAARFNAPLSVAVDSSGNLYVADYLNHTIRKITPPGTVSTLAGLARVADNRDGTGNAARFSYPQGVAVDGSGTIYVADTGNVTIRKVTPAGVVTTLAGSAGNLGSSDGTGGAARFNNLTNLATDASGNIYVTDRENHVVRKVTPTGTVTTVAGLAGTATIVFGLLPGKMSFPQGIAVTPAGDLVVTSCNGLVQATAF